MTIENVGYLIYGILCVITFGLYIYQTILLRKIVKNTNK